ncbi:MAG: hypothetical protein ACLFTL_10080, partial [Alphaproteobacteria bacterium]
MSTASTAVGSRGVGERRGGDLEDRMRDRRVRARGEADWRPPDDGAGHGSLSETHPRRGWTPAHAATMLAADERRAAPAVDLSARP